MERKRPWIEHAHYEALMLEARDDVNAIGIRLNEIAEIGAPQEQEIAHEEAQLEHDKMKKKTLSDKARAVQNRLNSLTDDLEAFDGDMLRHRKEIQNIHKRHKDHGEKIANIQEQIAELETTIMGFPETNIDSTEENLVSEL